MGFKVWVSSSTIELGVKTFSNDNAMQGVKVICFLFHQHHHHYWFLLRQHVNTNKHKSITVHTMVLTYKHKMNMRGHKRKDIRGKESKICNNLCSSWVTTIVMARVYYDLWGSHDGIDDLGQAYVNKHNMNKRLEIKRKKETWDWERMGD